ncbi:hypothetical protein DSO57_1030360 [Entomophthora muscae]|uniref:Uncharacterized protein n=1 Tax=Entomophthora muscae TaxID=34485 RepID=A0ACC2T184_9FUNG|nr:hypothetical protein DSO57_1030360 [Entomophthora muscae]
MNSFMDKSTLLLVQLQDHNYLYLRRCQMPVIPTVRIDTSSLLETRAQEQKSNPDPGSLWAAGLVDRRTACLRFSEIESPQTDVEKVDPCGKKSQNKEIITPNGGLITAPNRGTDLATISFINLKSTPATNQEQPRKEAWACGPVS